MSVLAKPIEELPILDGNKFLRNKNRNNIDDILARAEKVNKQIMEDEDARRLS